MSNKKPKVDYGKDEFIEKIMNVNRKEKRIKNKESNNSNKEYDNRSYLKDYRSAALKFYNIEDKYIRLGYGSENRPYQIQYEIAQLFSYMLINYSKSIIYDYRVNNNSKTLQDINDYNKRVIDSINNSEVLPGYIKDLFKNNNTYRYNENFGDLSEMLMERLSQLFYLTFNTSCQNTEKIMISLIEEIDAWNYDIMNRFYQNDSSEDQTNSEIIEDIPGLEDITENNNHSIDTNITKVFEYLIRKDSNKPNLLFPEELISFINSNIIFKENLTSKSFDSQIKEVFNEENYKAKNNLALIDKEIKNARLQYLEILNSAINEKLKISNYFNCRKTYEDRIIDQHMGIIKIFSNPDYAKENKSILQEFIAQELMQHVYCYLDNTLPIPFSYGYGKIISTSIDIYKYFNIIDEFILNLRDNDKSYKDVEEDNLPLIPEYLIDFQTLQEVLIALNPLILKLSTEITNDVINNIISEASSISDRVAYNNIKENINIFLGQIYLQVILKEHSDFITFKSEENEKRKNKTNKTKKQTSKLKSGLST